MNREGRKCVIYPRVSTEMQVEGFSLDGQKRSLMRFADSEGMEVIGVYEEAGKSGKTIEGRPEFKRMLHDIKNGLDIEYVLAGMVNPMINFPHVITLAIATSLVPLIAGAYKEGNNELAESNIQLSGRTAMLIGMPCAVGFFVLAKPILQTLFYSQKVVMDEVSAAFMIMAVAVMFLASVQTLTSILQGVGKQMIPVRNMFIGVGVKILCTWFLVPVPSLGIKGAAIGTILAYTIATVLDTMAVTKYTGVSFEWKRVLLKPGISAVSMGVIVFGSYRLLIKLIGLAAISEHIQISMATMFSILVGIIIYYILIIVTQAVDKEDIMKLPKGEKLYNFAGRFIKQ